MSLEKNYYNQTVLQGWEIRSLLKRIKSEVERCIAVVTLLGLDCLGNRVIINLQDKEKNEPNCLVKGKRG